MKPFGIIYLTSRVENGEVVKKYIGQHKLTDGVIEDGYLGSGDLLRRAIKKYGRECFAKEVLELCYSQEEMNKAEEVWISLSDAVNSDEFYNISPGGYATEPKRKTPVHQYGKDGKYIASFPSIITARIWLTQQGHKVRSSSIPQTCSTSYENRFRKLCCGYQWSYELHPEGIQPISKYHGKCKAVEKVDPKTLKVVATYNSLNEASEMNGTIPPLIHKAIKGGGTSSGALWKFKDKPLVKKKTVRKLRGVQQLDKDTKELLADFSCIKDASESVGVCIPAIHHAITKGTTSAGFCWKFTDCEYGEAKPRYREREVRMLRPETGEFIKSYASVVKAAEELGGLGNSITYAIRHGYKSRGHRWEYAD